MLVCVEQGRRGRTGGTVLFMLSFPVIMHDPPMIRNTGCIEPGSMIEHEPGIFNPEGEYLMGERRFIQSIRPVVEVRGCEEAHPRSLAQSPAIGSTVMRRTEHAYRRFSAR